MQTWKCALVLLVVVVISQICAGQDEEKTKEKGKKGKWGNFPKERCFDKSKYNDADTKEEQECCSKIKERFSKWKNSKKDNAEGKKEATVETMEEKGKEIICKDYEEKIDRCGAAAFQADLKALKTACCTGEKTTMKEFMTCYMTQTNKPKCNFMPDCGWGKKTTEKPAAA